MKYEDFNGTIQKRINQKLEEIEKKEKVKILYAVESGSRAWGFASPDSDYDVRFIYIREIEDYLALEEKKDFIEWEINETFDINGWDIKKALKYFYRSNISLFEWGNSPIVYRNTEEWKEVWTEAKRYFTVKPAVYQYYGTANNNYHKFFTEAKVAYKKYFYVLRPLLACKWIREEACPPPVFFSDLMDAKLTKKIKPTVLDLIKRKTETPEKQMGERIDELDDYLKKELEDNRKYLSETKEKKEKSWEGLNAIFLELLLKDGLFYLIKSREKTGK